MEKKLIDFIIENEELISGLVEEIDIAKEYIKKRYDVNDIETLYILLSFILLKFDENNK